MYADIYIYINITKNIDIQRYYVIMYQYVIQEIHFCNNTGMNHLRAKTIASWPPSLNLRPTVIQFHNKVLHFKFDKRLGKSPTSSKVPASHDGLNFTAFFGGQWMFFIKSATRQSLSPDRLDFVCQDDKWIEKGFTDLEHMSGRRSLVQKGFACCKSCPEWARHVTIVSVSSGRKQHPSLPGKDD